ncbi:hypothetical protein [Streptosporangium sp. OZ121]|uniref:hypothetical protein n=1 Tax=Streptosporangium sp. OZ121 TaxID=3444183 RepID=UPI003F7A9BF6
MPTIIEDFADATLNVSLAGTWTRTSGVYRSPPTSHSNSSYAYLTLPAGALTLQFKYSVSSETNYDFFMVRLGGTGAEPVLGVSGEIGWTTSPVYNVAGVSQVIFSYEKDGTQVAGSDWAQIDDIVITTPNTAFAGWGLPIK